MNHFANNLMREFPDLFEKDKDEENFMLQSYMIDVPIGWERLVTELCSSIDNYRNNYIDFQPNPKTRIHKWIYWNLYKKIFNKCKDAWEDYKWLWNIHSFISLKILKADRHYLQTKPVQNLKILQIKEKFGTLRVYVSGGDERTEGMIMFAEKLSSKTCQESGDEGCMHVKGWWYATLSPEVAKEKGFVAKSTMIC